jgi:hypothetical protein
MRQPEVATRNGKREARGGKRQNRKKEVEEFLPGSPGRKYLWDNYFGPARRYYRQFQVLTKMGI